MDINCTIVPEDVLQLKKDLYTDTILDIPVIPFKLLISQTLNNLKRLTNLSDITPIDIHHKNLFLTADDNFLTADDNFSKDFEAHLIRYLDEAKQQGRKLGWELTKYTLRYYIN